MSTPINPALVPPGITGTPAGGGVQGPRPASVPAGAKPFSEVLAERTAAVPRFSKHAAERIARRGIELDGQTLARLAQGVSRAAAKGGRDSVVFVDGTAFVVSVPNNTVITAVSPEHMREQVFTNIDSAVIA